MTRIAHAASVLAASATALAFSVAASAAPTVAPAVPAAPAPAAPAAPAPGPGAVGTPWAKVTVVRGKSYELVKPDIVIGSDPACDVVINDPSISPRHMQISFRGGNAEVTDLGSKLGTLVAGTALKPNKPFKVMNNVQLDPGAVTLQFTFIERGTIEATPNGKLRKPAPKQPVAPKKPGAK